MRVLPKYWHGEALQKLKCGVPGARLMLAESMLTVTDITYAVAKGRSYVYMCAYDACGLEF